MDRKVFLLPFFLMSLPAWSSEERPLSGDIAFEAGVQETSAGDLSVLQYSRLSLRSYHDLTPELSLDMAGEARWQVSGGVLAPAWHNYPVRNIVDLEAEDLVLSDGKSHASLILSKAAFHFASGPLDVWAGLVKPEWGVSTIFRPADHFFPVPALFWDPDPPLASQALDVKYHLFDDFSVEAAGRLLEGGAGDWAVRLVDKSVAYTVVPSFAQAGGKNLLGLELLAVFPDFKAWGEGSYGLEEAFPGEAFIHRFNAVLGFSTVIDGSTLSLEMFKDGTGTVLGGFSLGRTDAAYFFASGGKEFPGQWAVRFMAVKSSCGGPLWLLPKATWGFQEGWEVGSQAHLPLEFEPGALSLLSAGLVLSIGYQF